MKRVVQHQIPTNPTKIQVHALQELHAQSEAVHSAQSLSLEGLKTQKQLVATDKRFAGSSDTLTPQHPNTLTP
jgi:hypothetical protein